MNSMSDSGGFQEVDSNHSGSLSCVPSQPAGIPSYRVLLSRDKRLPLDTWSQSGLQESVFGNHFSTFDSSRDHPQGIHSCATRERQHQFHKQQEQGLFSQEMTNKMGTQFRHQHLQEGRRP